jgi:hypothetical protein
MIVAEIKRKKIMLMIQPFASVRIVAANIQETSSTLTSILLIWLTLWDLLETKGQALNPSLKSRIMKWILTLQDFLICNDKRVLLLDKTKLSSHLSRTLAPQLPSH